MVTPECTTTLPNDVPRISRVRIGGATKSELLSKLDEAHVCLNLLAQALFADSRFTTAAVTSLVEVAEVSVAGLGLCRGATFVQIVGRAASGGLSLCPLEVGPYLRLQLTNQPEGFLGQTTSQNCAPPGAITVAS